MNEESQPQAEAMPAGMPDWFLQALVNVANGNDWEIGITLNVGGFLVSGTLISGNKYFEGFATEFSGAFREQDVAEEIRDTISKFGDIYRPKEHSEPELPPPSFIHLKEARFFHTNGNPLPMNRGVLWRGRLLEVSGFFLGQLSANNE